jgi:hypothetical protein
MILKDIPGFEGQYKISEDGNAYSLDRTVIHSNGKVTNYKGRKLKPLNKNGSLTRNSKYITIAVHRTVAKLWVDNPRNLPQVNHLDLIKTNNHFTNLEWTTIGENIRHYISKGRKPNKNWALILCLRTGIYYESRSQASKARGVNLSRNHLSKHDLLDCGNTVG